MRTEFWLAWGRIAKRHCQAAATARGQYGASGDTADDSRALGDEFDAALQSICSSAFSVEAVERQLEELLIPAATRASWGVNRLSSLGRLRETLKAAVDLHPTDVGVLVSAIEPVTALRGEAVHYGTGFEPPAPHPVAGQSSRAAATFTLEASRAAVAAMSDIYAALEAHPRRAAKAWAEQAGDGLRELSRK